METKTGTPGDAVRTDSSDEPISRQVIEAVAAAKGVDPLDLPPLYDSIDPDALDSFFQHDGTSPSVTSLTFEVGGCEVRVRGSGDVAVVRSGDELGTLEAESRTVRDDSRESVEERCGVAIGVPAENTHHG